MNRAFPRATMLLSRRSIGLPRHGEISDCENKSDERFAVLRLSKRKMRKEEKEREKERRKAHLMAIFDRLFRSRGPNDCVPADFILSRN